MKVDPVQWFGVRELDHCPPHFKLSATTVNSQRKLWVERNATGRYTFTHDFASDEFTLFITGNDRVAFENPSDAMMFELRWAGEPDTLD